MTAIVIRLPGPPEGKRAHRARIAGRGARQFVQTYPDARNVSYEGMLRQAAREAMRGAPPIEGAVTLAVHALMPVPASWGAKKRALAIAGFIRPTVKPDWDNFGKTCDALKEVVWRDDKQVVSATVVKLYAEIPELRIEVTPLERIAAVAGTQEHLTINAN